MDNIKQKWGQRIFGQYSQIENLKPFQAILYTLNITNANFYIS